MSTAIENKPLGRSKRRLRDLGVGYTTHNKVKLVNRGREFFDLLKTMIDRARHTIHLQTYIFGDDDAGHYIGDALIEAARRKVAVFLLVDGYASQRLGKSYKRTLQQNGVHFRFFEPFFRSKHFYFGRRLHHKIVVVDGWEAMVGSMNIADKYNDTDENPAWFDMGVHIKGEVAMELQTICERFWWGMKYRSASKKFPEREEKTYPESFQTPVRVRQNDWINQKGQATRSYFQLFHNAKEEICVVCSYVLPDKSLRKQLELAAKRGVLIRFVLAGSSDLGVVKAAERYLYRWMLRHNMCLFEYQTTVLHTKMAIADRELMTIGSYNLNNLSAYASVELNLDIQEKEFATHVQETIDTIIKKECQPVDLRVYTTHLFSLKQLWRWMAYYITRAAEKMITKK